MVFVKQQSEGKMISLSITNRYKFVFITTVSLCIICGCQRPNVQKNAESKEGFGEGIVNSSRVPENNLESNC
jgi:hypothetical protein